MIKALERFSERERRVIYAGAAAASAIVLYFFAAEPLYYGWRGMGAEIEKTAEHVARYKAAVAGTAGMQTERGRFEEAYQRLTEAVFVNDTDALSAAQMTEMVRAKAQAAGIALSSTKTERVEESGGFRLINVSVAFTAPLSALSRFLQEIQNDPKKMLVREAKIAAQKEDYPDDQPETLTVRMTITGLRYLPDATKEKL